MATFMLKKHKCNVVIFLIKFFIVIVLIVYFVWVFVLPSVYLFDILCVEKFQTTIMHGLRDLWAYDITWTD